ncbi:MAG: hypothetical protein KBD73_02195 [Candidatus Magasanikbacteria bacterium]|nr:hypothetical protein [Candidatus Magasanikbacteria bacterium]
MFVWFLMDQSWHCHKVGILLLVKIPKSKEIIGVCQSTGPSSAHDSKIIKAASPSTITVGIKLAKVSEAFTARWYRFTNKKITNKERSIPYAIMAYKRGIVIIRQS